MALPARSAYAGSMGRYCVTAGASRDPCTIAVKSGNECTFPIAIMRGANSSHDNRMAIDSSVTNYRAKQGLRRIDLTRTMLRV